MVTGDAKNSVWKRKFSIWITVFGHLKMGYKKAMGGASTLPSAPTSLLLWKSKHWHGLDQSENTFFPIVFHSSESWKGKNEYFIIWLIGDFYLFVLILKDLWHSKHSHLPSPRYMCLKLTVLNSPKSAELGCRMKTVKKASVVLMAATYYRAAGTWQNTGPQKPCKWITQGTVYK